MNRSRRKNFIRTIRDSLGRFLAIALIIALGAALFVGLRTTRDAMVYTAQDYLDKHSFYDFRVLCTYGYEDEDVAALANTEGIARAEGACQLDAVCSVNGGDESVLRFHSITSGMNTVMLESGRMPEKPSECLVDSYNGKYLLGKEITLTEHNSEDTLENITEHTFTVVGVASTPLYINFERGSTSLGTGKVSMYVLIPPECFDIGAYTEVYLRMEGDYALYSEEYAEALDAETPILTAAAETVSADRKARLERSARDALRDAEQEYEEGKAEAEAQLADAEAQLEDGRQQIEENEQKLNDGEQALRNARYQLQNGYAQLASGQEELDAKREEITAELNTAEAELAANEAQVRDGLSQVRDGLSQLDGGLLQLEGGIALIDVSLNTIAAALPAAQASIPAAENGVATAQQVFDAAKAALERYPDSELAKASYRTAEAGLALANKNLSDLRASISEMESQKASLPGQREALAAQRSELQTTRAGLKNTEAELNAALSQLEEGKKQLTEAREEAERQFAAAQAEIDANRQKLDSSSRTVSDKTAELEDGRQQLEDAKNELAEGESEYEQAKKDAEEELAEAARQLAEARESIEALEEPDTYVLDRTTNIGYSCFEGDADIVRNVAKIFPLFFFLIAALVCMTTVDKMIDEERSQIGTMKALGYSERSIVSKYLLYAFAASLFGVVLGTAVGTLAFPAILWSAYAIMYCMPSKILLFVDWQLCIVTVVSYLVCMVAVTWFSCRMTMRSVPAELIRPKSPPAGKRLLMERLFFWKKLPFLHKVTWRNIFRYKKRLFMTLLGVGGCTALLVTGFGFRDSIMDVAKYQFGTLTTYDASVNFSVGQPEDHRNLFKLVCRQSGTEACFVYETAVDYQVPFGTKSTTLVVPTDDLHGYWNLVSEGTELPMPGVGEVLLSKGVADAAQLETGDTMTVRTADMDGLTLTVSGVFDNNVFTYIIVSPETLLARWGEIREPQVAFLNVPETADAFEVSAGLMKEDYVANITVTEQTLNWVDQAMTALNAIIYLIVGMAAGLAFIVLYNLTNININERIREIATINVLGFRKRETERYLFRENLILSLMGSVLGLGMGKLLHAFVMDQIRIDMMCFDVRVTPLSYGISVALTMAFAAVVNCVLSFRLNRINMAEALKSNE